MEKTFTDEQKEIFEKFDDCWSEYASHAEEAIFAICVSAWRKIDARNAHQLTQKARLIAVP